MSRRYSSLEERLEFLTDKNGPLIVETPCWVWKGAKRGGGYGTMGFSANKKKFHKYAHRVAWEVKNGPIPDGMCLCHRCDNPACVNLDHIFLGTHDDNMADRERKGRHGKATKLKNRNELIERLRKGESSHAAAKAIGCHRTTAGKLRRQMLAELEEVWPEYKPKDGA